DPSGDHADEERDPGTVGDPDEDVSALVVGAEQEGARWPDRLPGRAQPDWRLRPAVLCIDAVPGEPRDHWREDRHDHDEGDDRERDYRGPVVQQPLHGQLP